MFRRVACFCGWCQAVGIGMLVAVIDTPALGVVVAFGCEGCLGISIADESLTNFRFRIALKSR